MASSLKDCSSARSHLETDLYAKNSKKRFHMLLSSDINAKTVHPKTLSLDDSNVTVHVQITRQLLVKSHDRYTFRFLVDKSGF